MMKGSDSLPVCTSLFSTSLTALLCLIFVAFCCSARLGRMEDLREEKLEAEREARRRKRRCIDDDDDD